MEYLFLFKFLNNKMSILSILSLIEPKPHHLEIIKNVLVYYYVIQKIIEN